ncbi:ribosomal protein S18-alanine N-acetyltransferase [Anaerotignum lactatifermentans]|uniref:ribosomal protein S18-alanine N-acetyltransferase n=1 Tax=Anaerotignum lactatifermentans TaxID=160404 RepID=UPI00266D0C8E|nr:ribosomal protein S18-alanine N-acetyltransferase [Anaerotignum lactatifermentans]
MFEIIPMTVEHIDGVLAVEEATFSIPWTRKDFEREMTENNLAIYYVAVADGKIVGYAGMWHVITEGHITNVAVLEDYRKQGVGDALMAQLEQVAMEKEMIGITLEVRISNAPAQYLYHKHGYRAEGLRKNYYPDTHEDAVIMWKYTPFYEGQED